MTDAVNERSRARRPGSKEQHPQVPQGHHTSWVSVRVLPGPPDGWSVLSPQVEAFWLPVIGPSCFCLARSLVRQPPGLAMYGDWAEAGRGAGLGQKTRSVVDRMVRFGWAEFEGHNNVIVFDTVKPPHARHIRKQPDPDAFLVALTNWAARQ